MKKIAAMLMAVIIALYPTFFAYCEADILSGPLRGLAAEGSEEQNNIAARIMESSKKAFAGAENVKMNAVIEANFLHEGLNTCFTTDLLAGYASREEKAFVKLNLPGFSEYVEAAVAKPDFFDFDELKAYAASLSVENRSSGELVLTGSAYKSGLIEKVLSILELTGFDPESSHIEITFDSFTQLPIGFVMDSEGLCTGNRGGLAYLKAHVSCGFEYID